jgi:hypothetical protein
MKAVLAGAAALLAAGAVVALDHVRSRAAPQSLEINGYTGRLGEWEVKADLARSGARRGDRGDELSGPMSLRHVGLCTIDGPEEKSGTMRVRLSTWSSRVEARLVIDGVECLYRGALSDTQESELTCPDRRPTPITLWAKE